MNPDKSIQDTCGMQQKEQPQWLELFLQTSFFGSCGIHESPNNELKKYCINCNLSACRYCIDGGSHAEHKVLKVYRHVYKDAVLLKEMEKHIDCSNIQAYKCNKQLVIALTPLPHCGSQTSGEGACDTCMRKLYEPNANRYCSITCKVQAFLKEKNDSGTPILAIQGTSRKRRAKRSRKGIPRKAPYF